MHNRIVLNYWHGGLCNNIVQLCHAIYLAESTCSYLEVSPHPGLLETHHDFDFTNGEPTQETISDIFYWLDENLFGVKTIDWNIRRNILKRYIRPMLPKTLFPTAGQDGLTIHIRSGDIFRRKPAIKVFKRAPNLIVALKRLLSGTHRVNSEFIQPPLAFYTRVIESKPWSRIILIAQDTENPTIHALLKAYGTIEFQPGSLERDIMALLSAQNLVIGYGTFGITWALLSDHIQSLYSPVVPIKTFDHLYPGDIKGVSVYPFEFQNYIPIGQWKATARQKQLMLKYCDRNILAIHSPRDS